MEVFKAAEAAMIDPVLVPEITSKSSPTGFPNSSSIACRIAIGKMPLIPPPSMHNIFMKFPRFVLYALILPIPLGQYNQTIKPKRRAALEKAALPK
ncbi:hypothetical protein JCM21738_3010 [Mesobacillus boroniphilus JCM 21738]|uniref:Uncharacterized protein n=1 Tax=Mesobacillus boroniphilus JCM 21738 TaxID=1294265 RepID=W4RQI7_9BACI|nr:hypothetical protein JCM21738_3010 [Mesobacillus boroniphilus JCM 21738]